MKKVIVLFGIIVVALLVYYHFSKNTAIKTSDKPKLIAPVKIAQIVKKTLTKYIVAYGVVQAQPNSIKAISLNFDCIINNISILEGQNIKKGETILSVSPSPIAKNQLMQAESALQAAYQNLQIVESKLKLHLATTQDLLNAQTALKQAQINYENLKNSYISNIESPFDGIVTKINYTEGANVPAGSPVIQIAKNYNFIVKCSIEPEDVNFIELGTLVKISMIDYNKTIDGKIVSISKAIDPSTHLLNVYINPIDNEQFLLNSYAEVKIPISQSTALTVPKSALLYENGHYIIFTVENGIAKKHLVNVIQKNDQYAQINAQYIKQNDKVVTEGAYELQNNMPTRIE